MDIVFLLAILGGTGAVVYAQVLKHMGMWDLRNDYNWSHYSQRGIRSPYEVTTIGVMLIAVGIIGEIGITFGLRARLWSAVAAAVINGVINTVWLRHIEDDDNEPRTSAAVGIGLSVAVLCIAGLMLFLI